MSSIRLFAEDQLLLDIGEKIVKSFNPMINVIQRNEKGKGNILRQLESYAQFSNTTKIIALVDLDDDICAKNFWEANVNQDLVNHDNFIFRAAIYESEAWLMADRQNLSVYLGITTDAIPEYPEEIIIDPKSHFLNILSQIPNPRLRSKMIKERNNGRIGRNFEYNETLSLFIRDHWNPHTAAQNAPSLHNTINRIKLMLHTQ